MVWSYPVLRSSFSCPSIALAGPTLCRASSRPMRAAWSRGLGPSQETLEFGQRERNLAITDITYYRGEIFVAGISNEEFASKLRRIHYPFPDRVSTSSIEIWHSVHAEFETRAPIIKQMVRDIDGAPYLIAVY